MTRQEQVCAQIALVRAAETTLAQAARELGVLEETLHGRIWREVKADVFARDGRCLRCGRVDGLDAHHRIPRGMGGTDRPEIAYGMANLISLCRRDHDWVESHRTVARDLGLLVHSSLDPAEVAVALWGGRVRRLFDARGGYIDIPEEAAS